MAEIGPVRFGIIGCGSASVPVCEAIRASAQTELVAVYDVNQDLARDLQERFQVPAMSTLNELLANPLVDAVYIGVPHYLLTPLSTQALKAGKHALTEKPLALSLEDIDALIALSDQRQLTLGVFYEMRYASPYSQARQFVQDGAIGRIVGVQIQTLIDKPLSYWQSGYTGRSVNPWRGSKEQAGGGVVLMNTSHLLDALAYVTGLRVTQVSAEIGTLVADVEVEDVAAASLRLNNGAIGSLIAGAHMAGANDEECCYIYGTQGQIRLPDPYGNEPLQIYFKEAFGSFTRDQWHSIPRETVPVYQCTVEDFAEAVQSRRCPRIGAWAARYVLSVVLAIYQSAREGRPISIQEAR